MRAMVLDAPAPAAARGRAARARAGPGRGAPRGRRLRRLPHRPPHRRRRADRAEAAAGARPPDRRAGARAGASASRPGERVGVPWLGWTDGECRYCRSGRENLCDRARFTGYDLRRRLRRARGGGRALLLPDPRRLRGPPGRAAAVRGADRLPDAAHGRRRRAARDLRLRRGGAHRLPGGRPPGPARVRVHARRRRRRRRPSRASWARSGRATPSARRPRSWTPRSCSPRRASSCPRRCGRSPRAAPWSAAAST